jgi:hypothetical protein
MNVWSGQEKGQQWNKRMPSDSLNMVRLACPYGTKDTCIWIVWEHMQSGTTSEWPASHTKIEKTIVVKNNHFCLGGWFVDKLVRWLTSNAHSITHSLFICWEIQTLQTSLWSALYNTESQESLCHVSRKESMIIVYITGGWVVNHLSSSSSSTP